MSDMPLCSKIAVHIDRRYIKSIYKIYILPILINTCYELLLLLKGKNKIKNREVKRQNYKEKSV